MHLNRRYDSEYDGKGAGILAPSLWCDAPARCGVRRRGNALPVSDSERATRVWPRSPVRCCRRVPCRLPPMDAEQASFSGWTTFQGRSEEHTSELQSLMRISYAVFCLKKKNISTNLINK